MLRATSAISVIAWASLGVGATLGFWQFGGFIYAFLLGVAGVAIVAPIVMLVRNRPFFLGWSLFVSVLGLLPGFWGIALFFYCVGTASGSSLIAARPVEWLLSVGLALMFVPPINWAILWRDCRHDAALNI